jgi:hypothetical protein
VKFPYAIGWNLGENNCQWCPHNSPERNCGVHKQSPIDLTRDPARTGTDTAKECPDWHTMQQKDGSCKWENFKDQFDIMRHALRMNVPQLPNGDVDCIDENGLRVYPRLDYSKGFPDYFFMQSMEISVPSQHRQQGKRYAAEVMLYHFYEIDQSKNKVSERIYY